MALTSLQKSALKTAILADGTMNAFPNNADGNFDLAVYLNQEDPGPFKVWNPEASVSAIQDAITWDKYTPTDAPDNTATFTNRMLAIQTKQMNLQLMLQGKTTVDASKSNVRAGLRDAVTVVPSGAGGGSTAPGGANGVNVLNACVRNGLRIEKILTTGTASLGGVSADVMGYVGSITPQDVEEARNS